MTSGERENQSLELAATDLENRAEAHSAHELVTSPGTSIPATSLSKARDRIVILGRRRAGKTIYLARLYEQLWKSATHFHMRAISGETHRACMQVIEELRLERWPASTLGAQYADIEITYKGSKHLLVALDYPGEVFKKAFVDNADTDDARELLDHVDRAAAVIMLLDPAVVQSASIEESIDDDFGMVQAVHRIREWPGGERVPLVLVFTKADVRKNILRQNGGLRAYATQRYMNLIRAMGHFKVFACAAVHAALDANGKAVPSVASKPIGVIEPLEYCLEKIAENQQAEHEELAKKERLEAYRQEVLDNVESRRKAILFWSIFWSAAVVVIAAIGLVTWILTHGTEPP